MKTPKPKANSKPQSVRSRAARRAVSPSVDIDRSLTSLPRPESPGAEHSVLSTQHGSGISKKSKQKPKSRAQRLRQEKGMERAEAVMDKTEIKVSKSTMRGKKVQARRANWDEMNTKIVSGPNGNTQPAEAEKASSVPSKKDVTLETPEESQNVDDTAENPDQNSISNAALDMDEDEEIT